MMRYPWCGDDIRQGEEIIRGECARISGAGSIGYLVWFHTSTSTLPASFSYAFGGDQLPSGGVVIQNAWISFMVGWLSYGVGNLKSTTSPPHAIEGSVFHVKRGCVTCWGWGGVFMGSWAVSFFWFYGDVVVSRGTWAMLVKEIFCDCSHVSWCLKVSRCFTWNTTFLQQPNCFTWNVGCFCCRGVFWVLVFLVGGGCFTWNMGNACNEIPRVYGRAL